MSHSAEQVGTPVANGVSKAPTPGLPIILVLSVLMAAFAHGFIAYSRRPFDLGVPVELLLGTLNFIVVVFLFYGISTMVLYRKNLLLAALVVPAVVMSLVLTKSDMNWITIAGWSAVIAPSVICGRLAVYNYSISKIFSVSVVVLVMFGSVQMIPMWQTMTSSEAIAQLILETEPALTAAGYSAEYAEEIKSFLSFFLRVLPALTVMSVIMQFALGFWLFARWQSAKGNNNFALPRYTNWRVHFAFTPILLLGVLSRLFGNDAITIVADNILLVTAMFYSITGLALLEFLMQRARVNIYLKLAVYLLIFLFHIIGFAAVALLGFVDSFFDWRRKYPLPLGFK